MVLKYIHIYNHKFQNNFWDNSKEAEKIISEFNKPNKDNSDKSKTASPAKTKTKKNKLVKSNQ